MLTKGINDDTGALAEVLTDKYLGYCVESGQMGNKTAMIPGLIDVSLSVATTTFTITNRGSFLLAIRQLTGALFLKAGGWETVVLHSRFNKAAYWYSFEFFGKISLLSVDEMFGKGNKLRFTKVLKWQITKA